MLGAQRACAFAAGAAFIVNLVLCYALIPSFGLVGAAVSTTIAFAFESALIFNAAKKKFGIHLFIVPSFRDGHAGAGPGIHNHGL
jgi:O-antigen/teichoic acid export membrane protein